MFIDTLIEHFPCLQAIKWREDKQNGVILQIKNALSYLI